MICERCGKEMSNSTTICPSCGTVTLAAPSNLPHQPPTSYGPYPPSSHRDAPPQQPVYGQYEPPQPAYSGGHEPQQGGGGSSIPPAQYNPGYVQSQGGSGVYAASFVTVVNNPPNPNTFTNTMVSRDIISVIVEVMLGLFGIFGVGWLMAGETTIGLILLIGSFLVYWPTVIFSLIITFGFAGFCDAPLALIAVAISAILLHSRIKNKAMQSMIMTTSPTNQGQPQYQYPPRQ